jgi:hypothetical protein
MCIMLRISRQYLNWALVRGIVLFSIPYTVVLQKVLGRTFLMVQLCDSNGFGSLKFCSSFAFWVLAPLFAFQLVKFHVCVLNLFL